MDTATREGAARRSECVRGLIGARIARTGNDMKLIDLKKDKLSPDVRQKMDEFKRKAEFNAQLRKQYQDKYEPYVADQPTFDEWLQMTGKKRMAKGGSIPKVEGGVLKLRINANVNSDSASRRMIDDVYSKYPTNPFNPNQRAMIEGEGEDKTLGTFELKPSMSERNAVELGWLSAYPHKQGVGSRTLKKLQEHAREHGVGLTLFPWEHGGVSQSNLIKFYKKHGFAPTIKGGKNMIWRPEEKSTGGSIPSLDVMRLAIGGQGPKNWVKGALDRTLKPLVAQQQAIDTENLEPIMRQAQEPGPLQERAKRRLVEHHHGVAINQWIERNLANYVKKQMATHDDPVRKLAEQGILHIDHENLGPEGMAQDAEDARKRNWAPRLGKSDAAQAWEDATDVAMESRPVFKLSDKEKEPWMDKLHGSDHVYYPKEGMSAMLLGFDHIVDVLKQDLAEGRIRPEQLSKVSMEQAVRRTHEYNEERKKAMAQTALKATEDMPVHKDYGDGFKWIELALPESRDTTKGHPKSGEQAYKQLEDALEYEGNTMGHCVGGYTPDVAQGKSRIFSLRDAKNEPHVTIEVKPPKKYDEDDVFEQFPGGVFDAMKSRDVGAQKYIADKLAELNNAPHSIKQIKGKANAKPKKQYLPYVHDFVKSQNWSHVGDLQNTDLINIDEDSDLAKGLKSRNLPVPQYVEQHELKPLLEQTGTGSYTDRPSKTTYLRAKGGSITMDQMKYQLAEKKPSRNRQ
jgi:GNAT superfamily N-acetyltransferase